MFSSRSSRRGPTLPTSSSSPYYRADARVIPGYRRFLRHLLSNPLNAFVALVIAILALAWLFGLTKPEERVRLGGGHRVVARDWSAPEGVGHKPKLKSGKKGHPKPTDVILILTPMKNSLEHIWHYFHLLDTLSYPRHLIQLGILVSDSSDRTYLRALELADERQYSRKKSQHYGRISVFRKDFVDYAKNATRTTVPGVPGDAPAAGEAGEGGEAVEGAKPGMLEVIDVGTNVGAGRHKFSLQVARRKLLAMSRTWLLGAAMTPEVDWVLWIDVDVVEYEKNLVETLLEKGNETRADVVVPNCMWKTYNEMGSYDRNNWAETPASLEMKKTLAPDDVLIEGYSSELKTFRRNMADYYPVTSTTPTTMALDGVGGCTTLVRADLHRQGAVFPAWPVDHQLETEGFAQIAKRLGGRLVGLPTYYVYHGLYG